MATIDFKILINITKPAFYSYHAIIPDTNEHDHHFGLREPLRQQLLETLNQMKDVLANLCAVHFAVAAPPTQVYQMEVNIYEYILLGQWAELCQSINNIMALSPHIHSIEIYPLSSRSSLYYQDHIPQEFEQNTGRIPFGILLGTGFKQGTQAIGTLIINALRNGIGQDGYLVLNDDNYVISVTR